MPAEVEEVIVGANHIDPEQVTRMALAMPNFAEFNSMAYMHTVLPNLTSLGLITERTRDRYLELVGGELDLDLGCSPFPIEGLEVGLGALEVTVDLGELDTDLVTTRLQLVDLGLDLARGRGRV